MLQQLKENPLGLQSQKGFPLRSKENSFTKAFSINYLKEKSVYKVTKDFPLTSMADSHNSALSACHLLKNSTAALSTRKSVKIQKQVVKRSPLYQSNQQSEPYTLSPICFRTEIDYEFDFTFQVFVFGVTQLSLRRETDISDERRNFVFTTKICSKQLYSSISSFILTFNLENHSKL